MTTKVDIYNGTLGKLGVETITSLTEDSKGRRALDTQYDNALTSTLEGFGWRFAKKRTSLAKDSASPDFGFENQFILPSDYVRTLSVWNGSTIPEDIIWEEEGGLILTDEETFYIIYTYKETNPGKFSELFVQTLQYQLASLTAMALKNSRSLASDMFNKFAANLVIAETQDAKKRSRRKTSQRSPWIEIRGALTPIEPAQVL